MSEKLEVVADLEAHDLIVWFVFVREFAVFDVDNVLPLHCLAIDHSKSQLCKKICFHIEEDCPDSDLIQIVKQLYFVDEVHLLKVRARHLVVLDESSKSP